MKLIFKIALTELKNLFYSPVAWIVLVIFTWQTAGVFTGLTNTFARYHHFKTTIPDQTFVIFGGLIEKMHMHLWYYIPLITMSVISRDFSIGSIKLFYSSPVTSRQIVLGKFTALAIFGLLLTAIAGCFGGYLMLKVVHADIPYVLTVLLGLFLMICSYAAIGLFISSLTSYAVVAGMVTLAVLGAFEVLRIYGQDFAITREIAWWLSMEGRMLSFLFGELGSEEVLYCLIIIGMFLTFTVIRLNSLVRTRKWLLSLGAYVLAAMVAMTLGYFSSRPSTKFTYDATATKKNTLNESSRQIVAQLKDSDVTINAYVNSLGAFGSMGIPRFWKNDQQVFRLYTREKPDIKMKYHYYYKRIPNPFYDTKFGHLSEGALKDTILSLTKPGVNPVPFSELVNPPDLAAEGFDFVRKVETGNGRSTMLRIFDDPLIQPMEAEISAALKKLVVDSLPVVGFLTGHKERESLRPDGRGYSIITQEKSFRHALINQGLVFEDVPVDAEIPAHIQILVIAEPRMPFSPEALTRIEQYIEQGGNLIIAGEPERNAVMNPLVNMLGLSFKPGTVVAINDRSLPFQLVLPPTKEGQQFSHHLEAHSGHQVRVSLPGASAIETIADKGFRIIPLVSSPDTASWNETETTNFIDDSVKLNAAAGETIRSYPLVVALDRKKNGRDQRIIVAGDADWLSNAELIKHRAGISNFALSNAAFYWLSHEEMPVNMDRPIPPDNDFNVDRKEWKITRFIMNWVAPGIILMAGLIVWTRRRGR